MDIRFNCSNCGQKIAVDPSSSGMAVQCPACQASLRVPGSASPSPQAAPARKMPSVWIVVLVAAVLCVAGLGFWLIRGARDKSESVNGAPEQTRVRQTTSAEIGDPKAEVLAAAAALNAQSYSWRTTPASTGLPLKSDRTPMIVEGTTDGRLVYLKITGDEKPGHVAYQGKRVAFNSGKGWQRLDTSDNPARQRAGKALMKNQPPGREVLTWVNEAKSWERSGEIIRADLNEAFALKILKAMAEDQAGTNRPAVNITKASGDAEFTLAAGQLRKINVMLKGTSAQTGKNETEISYSTVWETIDSDPAGIPAEARSILQ